jgi:hypothetical protein
MYCKEPCLKPPAQIVVKQHLFLSCLLKGNQFIAKNVIRSAPISASLTSSLLTSMKSWLGHVAGTVLQLMRNGKISGPFADFHMLFQSNSKRKIPHFMLKQKLHFLQLLHQLLGMITPFSFNLIFDFSYCV